MRVLIIILLFIGLSSTGCKKDSAEIQPDCQANNYGTFRLNVSSSTLRHHILVVVGFGAREKDLQPGILTDTMHLPPGIFSTFITSNNGGAAIDSDVSSITIEQCKEAVRSVPF